MDNKKISVAMTTYNGCHYILEQLDSIYLQTRKPDEVIICDDRSSDDTIQIINSFIIEHNLSNWILQINEYNLGWQKNFYKAIGLAKGDIIFFSDQDDIWELNKIEKLSSLMVRYNLGCLVGGRTIINETGARNSKREEKRDFSNKLTKVKLNKSFYDIKTLGCCMCVSRKVADLYLSINYPEGGHDSQCGRIAVLFDSLWKLDTPVIKYRIHTSNSSGISGNFSFGSATLQKRLIDIEVQIEWAKRVTKLPICNENQKVFLTGILEALEARHKYLSQTKRLFISMLPYSSFYSGFSMFIGDWAYKHNINRKLGYIRWNIQKVLR
ncbi:MAG: glycosyltransferase [Bacteroidales bacterium]|nr:glycosyltransferase [Bacteroidales bacterium]